MKFAALMITGLIFVLLSACSATSVPTTQAQLGQPGTLEELKASLAEPGVIEFEKHVSGDWAVSLAGMVNLEHPKAKAAGLTDQLEPIQIFTYSLRHPTAGTFIVDSGLSERFIKPETNQDVSWLVNAVMGSDQLKVLKTTRDIAERSGGIDGVFLTHIHMDHIMGLRDLNNVPVYLGPGDAEAKDMTHSATRGTTDRLLGQVDQLREWQYGQSGLIDVFGDGSLWAIHSPGHTPGATAYLANTTSGPQLMLGDVTHTRWGWENGVEPGSFSADVPTSAASLKKLKTLSQEFPEIKAHPGHQALSSDS